MASAAQRRIKSISYARYGYFFILPFFIVYAIFQLWPLINTFVLSFYGNGPATIFDIMRGEIPNPNPSIKDFVGLDNYKAILFGSSDKFSNEAIQHNEFVLSLKNTIILWVGNFVPQIILSLSLAVWFTDARLKIPGKGFFKVVMYMPNIITAASVSVLFLALCSRQGTFNSIITSMGGDTVDFLKGEVASRGVVMFIQTWLWFGNTMIMLMSGIMGINPSLFEAAEIDGASSTQVFWRITFPLLSPIMVYTFVTSMIGGLQMFDIPYLYHEGTENAKQIQTMAVYIYNMFFDQADPKYGYAGAASILLFFITVALGSITFAMNRDKDAAAKKKHIKKLKKQAKATNKQFGGLTI